LLVDDFDPAREMKLASKTEQVMNKVRSFVFNPNSLWFKMEIKTFPFSSNSIKYSLNQQAS
jgi:hypothetical protein